MTRPLLSAPTASSPAIYSPSLVHMTYETMGRRRTNVGRALACLEADGRLGPKGPNGELIPGQPEYIENAQGFGVGIWSTNRPEWQIVDFAAHMFSHVGVALYETLGPNVVEYVVNHAPVPIVFTAAHHIPSLLKLAGKCPTLRVIVSMDDLSDAERKILDAWGLSAGIEVLEMSKLEAWGEEEGITRNIQPRLPSPETIATISYTSGTTGDPKGVILTHHTVTSGVLAQSFGSVLAGSSRPPVMISYLPLAHIMERFLEILMIYGDGSIGYTTGDPLRLLEDAQIIKPNAFPAVPRVLNRIHQAIMAQVAAGGLKGALLKKALDAKIAHYEKTGQTTHAFYDAVVFRKVRALLGGNVDWMCTGSAPISGQVLNTLRACFSCDIVEGYGLTETVGTGTSGIGFDPGHTGNTGPPRTGVLIKLKDVPELSYTSSDKPYPRGEILMKGPNIFSGYHKNPKATKDALDSDGWFHTGDIAAIDHAGRIKIVDRIKNVIKLSQGEYVALEKVEGIYSLFPLFASVLVHGDSLQSHIVLIAVVDPVQAAALVNKILGTHIPPTNIEKLRESVKDPKVRDRVLKDVRALAKKNGLNGFETIKGIHLEIDPFPEAILTPTLKVKRQAAAQHYRPAIDAMYAEVPDLIDSNMAARL